MMNKSEVVNLMKNSITENEWNDNCAKVRDENGGDYPDYWGKVILGRRV